VLSRVDGTSSETDIAAATGLPPEQVSETLVRLEALGAVSFALEVEIPPVSERPKRAPPRPSGAYRLGVVETRTVESDHPAAALYDPNDLDEEVDIELGRKRQILDLYYRLDSATHYQLFGVTATADKKVVKNAYYEIVGTYHPDRYFGKKLGSFKTKLEKIFARLTEAYDVLTRPGPRAEYDSYLEAQRRTRAFDQALEPSQTRDQAVRVAEIQRQIEEEARSLERADHGIFVEPSPSISELDKPPESAPPSGDSSASGTRPVRPPATAPLDPEARRRALARKLGRSLSGQMPAAPSAGTPSPPPAQWAADQLKRRYEQHVQSAKTRQVEHYVAAAEEAFARKDPISGVNALRIAAGLVPDDAALKARLDEAQKRTELELANSYIEQAQYEEREGRLAEAARSYDKATRGKPSARLHERTAHCLLESGGDVRLAGEHAKKAVQLAPDEASYHVTLARFFAIAGMKQSALGALERAATLAPKDDTIKDSIKRLKKGQD
jgi:curved DNA-binding protein CbpA/Tfp pilus assembly protein PilF